MCFSLFLNFKIIFNYVILSFSFEIFSSFDIICITKSFIISKTKKTLKFVINGPIYVNLNKSVPQTFFASFFHNFNEIGKIFYYAIFVAKILKNDIHFQYFEKINYFQYISPKWAKASYSTQLHPIHKSELANLL